MKIAFIRPSMFGEKSADALKPLIFSIIKPLTPDFAQIRFYDEMIETLPRQLPRDVSVVAFTVDTFSARRSYELARRYKREGRTIVMGGFHPTASPQECLRWADAVVIGEAEDTWGELLKDLKNGCLKQEYVSSNGRDLGLTRYDYSVFAGKKYPNIGIVQFSRGCKYRCDFCSINAFYKGSIRVRPVEQVVRDLKNLKEKIIFFIDDNLFADEAAAVELFKAIAPLHKRWVCQISMDIAENPAILRQMKQSGCMMVLMGFESLDVNNLKLMGKSANIRNKDYDRVIRNIYDAGIMIYGTFVIGYPYDTPATAGQLADFALKHKFAIANFNPLMALPDTRLYDRLAKSHALLRQDWWIHPDFRYGDAMFKPANMTETELKESCRQARYRFSSFPSIFNRLFLKAHLQSVSHASLFLVTNLISHVQIKNKQGRKLGGKS